MVVVPLVGNSRVSVPYLSFSFLAYSLPDSGKLATQISGEDTPGSQRSLWTDF